MNALEFYRLRNDLTQEELGKRIGVSKQTIYKWEKQIAPVSSKHYQTLKDILNLSESEMVNVISGGEISRDASVAENIDPVFCIFGKKSDRTAVTSGLRGFGETGSRS